MTAEEARKRTLAETAAHTEALDKERAEAQKKHEILMTEWSVYVVEWFRAKVLPEIERAIARREYRASYRLDRGSDEHSASAVIEKYIRSLGYTVNCGGNVQDRGYDGYPDQNYNYYIISW
jgi:hypothetical protein